MNVNYIIKLLLSKYSYVCFSLVYLFSKLYFNNFSCPFLTYVIFIYGLLFFLSNVIHSTYNYVFFGFILILLILLIQPISILLNTFDDKIAIARTFIIFFINFLIYIIPDFSLKNSDIEEQICKLSIIMSLISIPIFLITLIQYFKVIFSNEFYFNNIRLAGILGNPNLAGWFFLTTSICILFLIFKFINYRKSIVFFSLILFFNVLSLALTFCRSAIFSFVIVAFIFVYSNIFSYKFSKVHRIILLILTFIVLIIVSYIYLKFSPRGVTGRDDIYRYALFEFKKYNKIFGLGVGSIGPTWKADFDASILKYGDRELKNILENNTHNVFLRFLCVNGIVGLLIYVLFTFYIFIILFRLYLKLSKLSNNEKNILAFITAFVISGNFISLFDEVVIFNIIRYINLFYLLSISYLFVLKNNLSSNKIN